MFVSGLIYFLWNVVNSEDRFFSSSRIFLSDTFLLLAHCGLTFMSINEYKFFCYLTRFLSPLNDLLIGVLQVISLLGTIAGNNSTRMVLILFSFILWVGYFMQKIKEKVPVNKEWVLAKVKRIEIGLD